MGDWIGFALFLLVAIGAFVGLRSPSKPISRTSEEFERKAAEGTTALGASMNALQELMNPEAAKSREVITQLKEGNFQKKRREGKAGSDDNSNVDE